MSDPYRIRPIEPRDNAGIAAIIRAVMPEFNASGPGFAIHDAEVGAMFEAYTVPRAAYFVIESTAAAGELHGGGGIAPLTGGEADTCELKKMYFLPALRGQGLGKALLTLLLERAHALGYRRCYLETLKSMAAANHLYRQFGFTALCAPRGATGHFSCDAWYIRSI